ncbi:MAG: 3-phosphoglycerate dehydrogenase [Betaproteobacteria bacterium]|nr:3-phosphoglycerate dehydrogenase [Betaproteobacteria bacterium]
MASPGARQGPGPGPGPGKTEVLVLNQIASVGLKRFSAQRYALVKEAKSPEVVLVRSQDLHAANLGPRLLAIGRAGAGTNNIPVAALSLRGLPVFNAPGANANAVKELVLAGMLLGARNLPAALEFVSGLEPEAPDLERRIEEGKKAFSGIELQNHTLGVIGLGRVGCLVADAAIRLGMQVLGYDPDITVDSAWSLPSQVRRANSIDEVLKASHFMTLHVPLVDKTRHLVNANNIDLLKPGAILLNFSREAIVEQDAVVNGLRTRRLRAYVTDFPAAALIRVPGVIALPHLGASTREAEENSAIMLADQICDYIENGNVKNAVNFPEVAMPRESSFRVAIANANVPNMLARISNAMGAAGLNIHTMLNKSRGEMAYTLVDVDSEVPVGVVKELRNIDGVLAVRYLPADHD